MRMRPLALVPILVLAGLAAGRGTARADDPDPNEVRGYVGFVVRPGTVLREGELKGLGIAATAEPVVTLVTPKGPGDKAGLKAGDVLLKYRGQDAPDTKSVDAKDPETEGKWREEFMKIAHGVKPGDEVEMVVRRKGETLTLKPKAVDKATFDAINQAAEEEERAVKVPSLKDAGAPVAAVQDFEKLAEDLARPADFLPTMGLWEVFSEDGVKPENHVLRQYTATDPWAVCFAVGKGHAYGDGSASVRFMPISGDDDASGGIVFRGQDSKNFYVARANALEDNLRVYVVKEGKRTQLATVEAAKPAMKTWHTLSVSFAGNKFKVTLDDKTSVEATDDTFATGWCGLWTKADSVAQFDDFKTAPASK